MRDHISDSVGISEMALIHREDTSPKSLHEKRSEMRQRLTHLGLSTRFACSIQRRALFSGRQGVCHNQRVVNFCLRGLFTVEMILIAGAHISNGRGQSLGPSRRPRMESMWWEAHRAGNRPRLTYGMLAFEEPPQAMSAAQTVEQRRRYWYNIEVYLAESDVVISLHCV